MGEQVLDRDERNMKEFLCKLVKNPETLSAWDVAAINARIEDCWDWIYRLRMGGRSAALTVLCILLWSARHRSPDVKLDVEKSIAKAFDICRDPSFIRPEWGIVLAGVLIAGYLNRLSESDDNNSARQEIEKQCRMVLRNLEGYAGTTEVVRTATGVMLTEWDAGFPNGLNPVIKSCLDGWPDTAGAQGLDLGMIRDYLEPLSCRILAGDMTHRERMLYKAMLELNGDWALFGRLWIA